MTHSPLMALCPLDGRYSDQSASYRPIFSEYALIRQRLVVECQWLIHLCEHLPECQHIAAQQPAIEHLIDCPAHFDIKAAETIKAIEQTTNHDVKAVEYYLRDYCKEKQLEALIPYIHFGATSEDINNCAYALMCQEGRSSLLSTLDQLINSLLLHKNSLKTIAMLARTHGQSASPTTVGKELANVIDRLQRQQANISQIAILAKFNGAVGNFNAHSIAYPDADWQHISQTFIDRLGLCPITLTTQIEPHDWTAELMHAICRINTICIDINRDIWGYISLDYFSQKKQAQEVGSSTMPHKVNPIDFENAEGNCGMANAIAQHLAEKLPISRWQRDLSDSTVMRSLGLVFGYSNLAHLSMIKGLNKLVVNPDKLAADLDQHWEVLAEAIQSVMRRYGIADAYEQLKQASRGQVMDKAATRALISQLAIPQEAKDRLLQLSPSTYIGRAVELADKIS